MSMEPLEELEAEAVGRMWSKAPVAEGWKMKEGGLGGYDAQAKMPEAERAYIPPAVHQALEQLHRSQEACLKLLHELHRKAGPVLSQNMDTPRLRSIDPSLGSLGLRETEPEAQAAQPSSPLNKGLFIAVSQRIEQQRLINCTISELTSRIEL